MKEIYKNAVKSFKDDIVVKDGIQFIPVTDAKAAIKFAMIDTIKKTVKECYNSSEIKVTNNDTSEEGESYSYLDDGCFTYIINKDSILSVADKLTKEL